MPPYRTIPSNEEPSIIGSIVISPQGAVSLLGTMVGGYNVHSLIELLKFGVTFDFIK
ncbi:hypothetical protein MiAbB_02738 [Microcystis aeruginosa NIES-4285]|jgi:aconitase B|uniref:Aconitase B HEAT-like domain-containing protein n=1 Tax=Microcystis aeruginosa NIES-4285 TaxID=2497681 RepID=A0A402DF65_MICAE|nr:hypothetical protein [Microcystis aeruginosa]GCE60814.1 hypothetical protein MiAbB_02738 [Microcystis aeruginosa NIES-4285]